MTTAPASSARSGGEWLHNWDPEGPDWDSRRAWKTLWISTFTLCLCFIAWYLPSAIVPKLTGLGFDLTKQQLYWLASVPGLAAGFGRLAYMVLPPIMGTRKMVTMTMFLALFPILGWAIRVQDSSTSFWELLILAALAGFGGGAFSGFMPSTSYFFPRRIQGTALGLQAGLSNFGVSIVQLATPFLVSFSMFSLLGASQTFKAAGKAPKEVWYQNAGFFWVPFLLIGMVLAWTMLKSVPMHVSVKQQFDIFGNPDTWFMTLIYIMTFGTFAGLSAQMGLLINNLFGSANPDIVVGTGAAAKTLIAGYTVPDPVTYVFWGPLIGAGTRVLFAPLTDKMGGAKWTFVSGVLTVCAIAYTLTTLSPDLSSAAALETSFHKFLIGSYLIFFTTGIGNASTFKQMPMIFERRQAGGVIGWTAAIAAFGPFLFGIALTMMAPKTFYAIGVAWALMCTVIAWFRYARPGAPRPS